ncbi:hypothetical protein [Pontibacter actiniarum]|uniref:Uncharacterized protein n=1 Tax=Pontibacter actiniarum TaxID=323450 RepID=A0A1X9YN58_9BACT|nr:hypothetical protein [Pontibacter actiniarum]ARS34323.1 hypothetical protein CA264_02080 [Pontibacter actiniarum]
MKITPHLLLSVSVFCLFSCSESEENKTTGTAPNAPAVTAPAQTQPANTQNTTAAVNPPHGAPNHRCDIPVGASLSLPPQPNLRPVPQFTPPAQGGTVAPGMNPPHGQPGHDCSIAVGAPLNK